MSSWFEPINGGCHTALYEMNGAILTSLQHHKSKIIEWRGFKFMRLLFERELFIKSMIDYFRSEIPLDLMQYKLYPTGKQNLDDEINVNEIVFIWNNVSDDIQSYDMNHFLYLDELNKDNYTLNYNPTLNNNVLLLDESSVVK